jgi:hypothetical protein
VAWHRELPKYERLRLQRRPSFSNDGDVLTHGVVLCESPIAQQRGEQPGTGAYFGSQLRAAGVRFGFIHHKRPLHSM